VHLQECHLMRAVPCCCGGACSTALASSQSKSNCRLFWLLLPQAPGAYLL
jgi:hypothetical protein